MDFQEAVEKIKAFANSKQGRIAIVVGTVLGASLFLGNLGGDKGSVQTREQRREYRSLIDDKTRKLYMRDIKAEQEETKKQVSLLQQEIEKLKQMIEEELSFREPWASDPQPAQPADLYVEDRLLNELRALRQSINSLDRRINQIERKVEQKRAPVAPEQVIQQTPQLPRVQQPTVRVVQPGQQATGQQDTTLLEGFYPAEEDKEVEKLFEKMSYEGDICLPQGSFGKVIALSGLSAPTGPRASQDPVPVLFVIPDKFIKPNIRRTYKLRNCFAIGWGAGDLSSERIKIRVNSVSCELEEGKPIKLDVAGYIAGPDGKEGIRGILVEKRGQYLAKALMASFVEGLSAVARYSTAVVSISPLGATQTVPPEKAFKYGFGLGLEKSLQRLSDYYLELADEVLPVIEIGSGVEGTLILLKPACTRSNEKKTWQEAVEDTKKRLARNPLKSPRAPSDVEEKIKERMFKPFYGGMME